MTGQTLSSFPEYSCAVTVEHRVKCWGNLNNYGLSADLGISDAIQVASGVRVCVLRLSGTVICFGNYTHTWTEPTRVADMRDIVQISAGDAICGVNSVGKLYCWGYNGNNNVYIPANLPPVAAVAVSGTSTCVVLKTTHLVECWSGGVNWYDVNAGRASLRSLNVSVPDDLGPVIQIVAERENIYCALTIERKARCWPGATTWYGWPTFSSDQWQSGKTFRHLSAGYWNICGIDFFDKASCLGADLYGVFPDQEFPAVRDLTSNEGYTCAVILSSNALNCFGRGYLSFDRFDGGKPGSIELLDIRPPALGSLTLTPSPVVKGSPVVGQTLEADVGNWEPGVTFDYQWFLDGTPLFGATGSEYIIPEGFSNRHIHVQVTGHADGFEPIARLSAGVLVVDPPRILGTTLVGETLSTDIGQWPNDTQLSYAWRRYGSTDIIGTESNYVLVSSDVGSAISVTVTGVGPGFTVESRSSKPSDVVRTDQLAPTFGAPSPTNNGFTVYVTNYDPAFTFTALVTRGPGRVEQGTPRGGLLPLTVTGLTPGQNASLAVVASRAAYESRPSRLTGFALHLGIKPRFSKPIRTSDGFLVSVTNYDSNFLFSASIPSGRGHVSIGSPAGTVLPLTVTGLSSGESASVDVVASKSDCVSRSAQVTGNSFARGKVAKFSSVVPAKHGFTVNVTNYDPAFSFAVVVASGNGSVTVGPARGWILPLEVKEIESNAQLTIRVVVSRRNYSDGVSTITGQARP